MQRLVKLLFQNRFVSSRQEYFASISPVLLLSLSSRQDAPFKDKGYLFNCDNAGSVYGCQKSLSDSTEELERFLKQKIEQADSQQVAAERDNLLRDDLDGLCGSLSEPLTNSYGQTYADFKGTRSFQSKSKRTSSEPNTLPVEKKRLEIDKDAAEHFLQTENIETSDYKLFDLTGHYFLGTPRCNLRWRFPLGKKKSWKQVPSFQDTDVTRVKDEELYAQSYSNLAEGMGSGFQRRARQLIDKLKGFKSGRDNPPQIDPDSPFYIDNPYAGSNSVTGYKPLTPMAPSEVPRSISFSEEGDMQSSDQTNSIHNYDNGYIDDTPTANAVVLSPSLTPKQLGPEQEKYWTLMQLFDKNKLIAIRPMDENILNVWGLKDFFTSPKHMHEAVYAKIQNAPLRRSLQEILESKGSYSIKYIGEHKDLSFLIMGENDEILAIIPPKSTQNKTLRNEKAGREFQSMQNHMIVACTMAIPEITVNDILMNLLVDVPEPPGKGRGGSSNQESVRTDEDASSQNKHSYEVVQFKAMDQIIGSPGSSSDKKGNNNQKDKQTSNRREEKCEQTPSSWYPKRSALDTNKPPINVGSICPSGKCGENSASAIDESVIMSYVRNSPHHKHNMPLEGHQFNSRCIGWVLCRPPTPNPCASATTPSANTMLPNEHLPPGQSTGYPTSESSMQSSGYSSTMSSAYPSMHSTAATIDQSGYPVTETTGYPSTHSSYTAATHPVPFPNVSHPDMCESHNYGSPSYNGADTIGGSLHGHHDPMAGCPWPSHLPCPELPSGSSSPVGTSTCPWPSYMPCPELPGNNGHGHVHDSHQATFAVPSQEQYAMPPTPPTMPGTQSQHYYSTQGSVPSYYSAQQSMHRVPTQTYGTVYPTAPSYYESHNQGYGSINYPMDTGIPCSGNHAGCIDPCHCVCPSAYTSAGNPTLSLTQSTMHQGTIHQPIGASAATGAYGTRTCPWVDHVPCPPYPGSNASISSMPHQSAAHGGPTAVAASFSGSTNYEDTSSYGTGAYPSVTSAGSISGHMPPNTANSLSHGSDAASAVNPQWPCVPFCHPCPHSCHLSAGGHTEYLKRHIVMAATGGTIPQTSTGGVMINSNCKGLCSEENEPPKPAAEVNTTPKSDNANSVNCSKTIKVLSTPPTAALFTGSTSLPPNIFDFVMLAAGKKAEQQSRKRNANSRSARKLSRVSKKTSSESEPKEVFSISTDQTCQLTPSAWSLKGMAEDAPRGTKKLCDSVSCSRSVSSGEFQPVTRISSKPDDSLLAFYGFRSVEEELQKTSNQLFPELKYYENGLYKTLSDLGITESNLGSFGGQWVGSGNTISSNDPAMGYKIVDVTLPTESEISDCIQAAKDASKKWANLQPPCRAVVLREIARRLYMKRNELATLISLEVGKVLKDALCEVRGVVNMFEYAAGLASVLSGNVFESERPNHLILERFLPLGTTGIVAAFNTPLSTFGKSATISLAVGNTVVFKPAETTTLSCIALMKIVEQTLKCFGLPPVVVCVQGDCEVGRYLAEDDRIDVLAFSGSTMNGQDVGLRVQNRFAKSLLNLTGLNGMIVNHDANFELALNAATLGIVDFAGQKKQKVSHVLVHRALYDRFVEELTKRIKKVTAFCGHPLDPRSIFGPLHSEKIMKRYIVAVQKIRDCGGQVEVGGNVKHGNYVEPAVVTNVDWAFPIMGPLAFVMPAHNIEEAIEANNKFPNLLSSSVFTKNIADIYRYIGPSGLSGGVISINTANTGTELTVPFGGDRAAGGGRLSGSDVWREYCRRVGINVNFSSRLPFAHGASCTLLS